MVENQTEFGAGVFGRGTEWKARPAGSVQEAVQEALDTELDAYLDRELFVQPGPEGEPTPEEVKSGERLRSVLALAAEEEQWLRTMPPPRAPAEDPEEFEEEECPVPEHLKPVLEEEPVPPPLPVAVEAPWIPPPAPLPGLAVVPQLAQPGWNVPGFVVPPAPDRTPWIAIGALIGVSTASLLVAGVLWMERDSLPDREQVMAAYVPAGTVTAVQPALMTPAPEPVLTVKDSPLPPKPEPVVEAVKTVVNSESAPTQGAIAQAAASAAPVSSPAPGAIAQAAQESLRPAEETGTQVASAARGGEVLKTSTQAETVKPREPAKVRRAAAVQERRDVEDPTLEETEEETPSIQPVVASAAPAEKPAPEPVASAEPGEYEEFDKDFARELGFTKDAVRKVPESKGVKSVWIPPEPAQNLRESLTPEDIQRVVVTNQPAITSCIQRNKEAIPGLNGGRFMMRWFIYPSGSTYGVAMETQSLRGTALATCIEGLVKDWKFPQHRAQMGPIRFPFVF
ncbi:AgmX/PglI C-terminal domain-containing protein [Hyalangium versicolor]|uniref:AgmX/PglI C-terminal domain-containing protein n=1 Tax=Hyalangium versicolor TaxID=2861190 RepID=UPI001CCCC8F5|nr:AgmX/PglI C-terminal domain-containing protein [Hyalangium versicolor]